MKVLSALVLLISLQGCKIYDGLTAESQQEISTRQQLEAKERIELRAKVEAGQREQLAECMEDNKEGVDAVINDWKATVKIWGSQTPILNLPCGQMTRFPVMPMKVGLEIPKQALQDNYVLAFCKKPLSTRQAATMIQAGRWNDVEVVFKGDCAVLHANDDTDFSVLITDMNRSFKYADAIVTVGNEHVRGFVYVP